MKHRNFRIAWSVAWGVVVVLLCVLWVRSFWWWDMFRLLPSANSWRMGVDSAYGSVALGLGKGETSWLTSNPIDQTSIDLLTSSMRENTFFGVGYLSAPTFFSVLIPHWAMILLSATIASIPWLRRSKRYSLRTLLIATTLIAVVLGIIVFVSRAG